MAGCPPSRSVFLFSSWNLNRSTCWPKMNGRIAHVDDLHLLHHLADDDADVLVVDAHALQTVDLLDLVEQVAVQLGFAEDLQDVVRVLRTVAEHVPRAHLVGFADQEVLAHGHQVLELPRRRGR